MAALDFNMAKARGLVAPIKEAEAALVKQAGGRNIFKSEDWWNDQYNKTIREGVSETKTKQQYLKYNVGPMSSGTSWADVGGGFMNNTPNAVSNTPYYGYSLGPTSRTVQYQEQRDLTQKELDSITAASKASQKRSKSELEATKASQKRLSRGTGGLLAKAPLPGTEGIATGMPALGETGLGIIGSVLGSVQKL